MSVRDLESRRIGTGYGKEGHCSVCMHIRGVTFGDIDPDGQEEALLVVSTNLGGTGTTIYGYIADSTKVPRYCVQQLKVEIEARLELSR